MIPQAGKVYLNTETFMVVVCIGRGSGPGMFAGEVLSPGRLAASSPVGEVLTFLHPVGFQLVAESKKEFQDQFAHHVAQTNPLTTEVALATFGGVS